MAKKKKAAAKKVKTPKGLKFEARVVSDTQSSDGKHVAHLKGSVDDVLYEITVWTPHDTFHLDSVHTVTIS